MLDRALEQGIIADYVLMDTWFWFTKAPLIYEVINKCLSLIGMVKQLRKCYVYNGENLTLDQLYKMAKPQMNKKDILGSIYVTLDSGIPVKIIFVRNSNKRSK
ncbi:hypothetical protein NST61_01625 [Caldifermentibacillus hisashii]|jgi:hypothetical protein